MAIYARLQNGAVAELINISVEPQLLFNPSLTWVLVTSSAVAVGWTYTNGAFAAPPPAVPPVLTTPSLAQLQAELASLSAQIAALTASSTTGATSTTSGA